MPSMTTLYRAIVMAATGIIVVKGWQLYGPTTEQVKAGAVRALEIAQSALDNSPEAAPQKNGLVVDPSVAAPSFAPANEAAPPASSTAAPPLLADATVNTNTAAQPAAALNATSPDAAKLSLVEAENMPKLAAADADRLPALLSRLESLGVAEPQLATWGSSGQMYRFCCRAQVASSPAFARHFESVAAEPLVAVEQVVAKVEEWRTAQQGDRHLR